MKKQWTSFLSGAITTLVLVGLVGGTFAAGYQKQATLNYTGVKITIDGVPITPTDADGNAVDPFIIDGTTYLPVRGVANALGLGVKWNQESQTVELMTNGANDPSVDSNAALTNAQKEILDKYTSKDGVGSVKVTVGSATASEKLKAVIVYESPYKRDDFQSLLTDFVDTVVEVSQKNKVNFFFVEVVLKTDGKENVYWHSYNSGDTIDGAKVGDLYDVKNDVSYNNVSYLNAGNALMGYAAPSSMTLTAGEYAVGKDVAPGTYDFSATSGTGNLIVYNASGKLIVNEVFGVGDGYTETYKNVKLNNGARITIMGDVRVSLTPVV